MIRLVAAAIAVATLSASSLALAHEGHKQGTTETIIIKRVHGDHAKAGDIALSKCRGMPQVDVRDEGREDGKLKRSRVVICGDGMADADIVKSLEGARTRLAERDELSPETRSKALAAIDAAIKRHRNAK